jgi:NADPH:quinone reductase-like Zn-dependent oxidoreductase
MKAAIIEQFGQTPSYADFPDPTPAEGEVLVEIKASVLENFDKLVAGGTHYSSNHLFPQFPAIIGNDGIGTTEDGQLVAFGNLRPPYGTFAEKAAAGFVVPIPVDIDPASAAAIPSSVLTSLLPLKYSAKLLQGETVLINGATGVSGRIAVQVAKMLGAGRVVGTGRDERSLEIISQLGADRIISLLQPDENLSAAFLQEEKIDVVVDFIWGHPSEVLLNTFIPKVIGFPKRRTRYLQIGEKAGSHVSIPAAVLRTSGLELMGIGMISNDVLFSEMANIWKGIKEGKFYMDIEHVPLAAIADAWTRDDLHGKRLVVVP